MTTKTLKKSGLKRATTITEEVARCIDRDMSCAQAIDKVLKRWKDASAKAIKSRFYKIHAHGGLDGYRAYCSKSSAERRS